MIALIDADTIVYLIGWNDRDYINEPSAVIDVEIATDTFVKTLLTLTHADEYLGTFSSSRCFRDKYYKVAKYKGTRPEKAEWIRYWQPIIKKRLIEKWGFYQPKEGYMHRAFLGNPSYVPAWGMEADDVISAMVELYGTQNCIICSPDKDLRQIPGLHYNYQKEASAPERVLPIDAQRNLTMQLLMGDSTDCITGIPGLGPKKAAALLDTANDPVEWSTLVSQQYCKYYGEYYGPIIYKETCIAVTLLNKNHQLWGDYETFLQEISQQYKQQVVPSLTIFE